MSSGYTSCKCRDCFEIAISDDVEHPDFCSECEEAGCEEDEECQAPGAYGGDDGGPDSWDPLNEKESPEPEACDAFWAALER